MDSKLFIILLNYISNNDKKLHTQRIFSIYIITICSIVYKTKKIIQKDVNLNRQRNEKRELVKKESDRTLVKIFASSKNFVEGKKKGFVR